MRRVLLPLIAVLALSPAVASATTVDVRPIKHPDGEVKVTKYVASLLIDAAERTTPGGACSGQIHWIFNDSSLDDIEAEGQSTLDGACLIQINVGYTFRELCLRAAHEKHHIAFNSAWHSKNPLSYMYESEGFGRQPKLPACTRAIRIYKRSQHR